LSSTPIVQPHPSSFGGWLSDRAVCPFGRLVPVIGTLPDFRITDLLTGDRPITLYLQTPESKLSALQPIRTLLWGTFINELNDTYDTLYKKHGLSVCSRLQKILFLIDEAGVTPIPELYKHVATVNGRGMSFVLGIQALSQLEMYGKANAETILGNCAKVFFEQESLSTAKYVSERLGGRSAFSSSQSRHGEETSEGKHEQKMPLLSEQEIMGMGETVIIFVRGLRYAIKAKRLPEFVKPALSISLLPAPKLAPEKLPNDLPRFPIPLEVPP
jgi:type IV secretion system protein VirD4